MNRAYLSDNEIFDIEKDFGCTVMYGIDEVHMSNLLLIAVGTNLPKLNIVSGSERVTVSIEIIDEDETGMGEITFDFLKPVTEKVSDLVKYLLGLNMSTTVNGPFGFCPKCGNKTAGRIIREDGRTYICPCGWTSEE